MRRLSDEDGRNAAARNLGRLALAFMPWAIAVGCLAWLAVISGWIEFRRDRRIDARGYDAVEAIPNASSKIQAQTFDDACLKIESAYLDGKDAVFYVRNTCDKWLAIPNFSYRVVAPDGTVIESDRFAFDGDRYIGPKERREQRFWTKISDRAARIEIRVHD